MAKKPKKPRREPDAKRSLPGMQRNDSFAVDPDEFYLPEPGHPRHDPLRFGLPVDEELAANIAMLGVIDPVVCRTGTNPPEVVDGMQRVKAARHAKHALKVRGLKVVFVRRKGTDEDLFGVSVAANRFRHEDPPSKLARDAAQMQARGASDREVEVVFGWSPRQRREHFALLNAPAEVRRAVDSGRMAIRTAAMPGAAAALAAGVEGVGHLERAQLERAGGDVPAAERPRPAPRRVTARDAEVAAGEPSSRPPARRRALAVADAIFQSPGSGLSSRAWFARGVEWALGRLTDEEVVEHGLDLPEVGL